MDKTEFTTKLKKISEQVNQFADKLNTEEATKNALIMPFFAALNLDFCQERGHFFIEFLF